MASWLSSLGSAASSLLAKGAGVPGLPHFGLEAKDPSYDGLSIWSLHAGVKRDDSSPVSIFVFDASAPGYGSRGPGTDRRALLPLARNALKKLRTLRHPDVLKFLDGSETDGAVYIVTEKVCGLPHKLREVDGKGKGKSSGNGAEEWKVWGLSRVVSALKFINGPGASTHGNVRSASIFITPSGEWRLGGFEVLSSPKDSVSVLYNQGGLLPESSLYSSPECHKTGYEALRDLDPACLDAYQLHLLLQSLFNPDSPLPPSTSTTPPSRGAIPAPLYAAARRLALPNPRSRLKPEALYDLGMSGGSDGGGFFKHNRLVGICEGLEGFALASQGERAALVRSIKDAADSLPPEFLKFKILPSLVQSFEHATDGPALLPLAISISSSLSQPEFAAVLLGPLTKLYASPDRAMRLALLDLLPHYAERLEKVVVGEKIWPHLVTGFADTVPVIREATLKSILLIAPKLSDRLLNNDLLRHLAKTQVDPEPGIRTNTCILLGRLSKHLSPSTCRKVLVPAFARSLRDPFTPARLAGLMALMATAEVYEKEDMAGRVIPAVSTVLVDKEKSVRDQAFRALDMFVDRVRKAAADMPDTAEPPAALNGINGASGGDGNAGAAAATASQPGLAMSAAGAAGALAGWAFSSVSRKLTTSDLASTIGPPKAGAGLPALSSGPVSAVSSTPAACASGSPTAIPGAFAGSEASSWGAVSRAASGSRPPSDEVEAEADRAPVPEWAADGDLMDVGADADDWSTFETGPPAHEPSFVPLPSTIRLDGAEKPPQPRAAKAKPKPKPMTRKAGGPGGAAGGALKLGSGSGVGSPLAKGKGRATLGLGSSLAAALEAEAAWDDQPADAWGVDDGGNGGDGAIAGGLGAASTPTAGSSNAAASPPTPSSPAAAAQGSSWGAFDDAPEKPASRAAGGAATSPVAGGGKEDKAAQMAKMREERRAKMAALKAKKAAGSAGA